MSYTLSYLVDHPEHLNTVANWYWQEWDKHEGWDQERSKKFAEKGMNRDYLDVNMIALNEQNECIGTIEIREKWGLPGESGEDLNKYSPWFGSLFVEPNYRGSRLAFDLCSMAGDTLKRIGYTQCHAATSHLDSFFINRGGHKIDETKFANESMRIYKFSL